MSEFSARVVAAWYNRSPWLWILSPLSLLFYLVAQLRRSAYQLGFLKRSSCSAPVIVVGNISVGGTGKTPTVLALVEYLQTQGFKPGIVSRGYGANPPSVPWLVRPEHTAEACGDEPLLLARRSGVPVAIDPDRSAACTFLADQHHCNVIIADDGLQHYAMARNIEIVVLDGARGVGNGLVLPAGPLREPATRLRSVDAVVVNGEVSSALAETLPSNIESLPMQVKADAFVGMHNEEPVKLDNWQGDTQIHAVAGIGNPQRFFDQLQQLGFTLIPHVFPDHHQFCQADLQFGDELPVIMTEKDAVKCRELNLDKRYWYLRVSAGLPASFFDTISALLPSPNQSP